MKDIQLNDREQQIALVAFENLRDLKQRALLGTPDEQKAFKQINQYDLLDSKHTLMHCLSLLSKLTGQPLANFTNPNPSQTQTAQTHGVG
jgi:hypothetical protein